MYGRRKLHFILGERIPGPSVPRATGHLPTTACVTHRRDGNEANHALIFKIDYSDWADQHIENDQKIVRIRKLR